MAFETLKACFLEKLLLHYFDLACKLQVETNTSEKAIGRILMQLIGLEWHFIVYFLQKMDSAQSNYETYNQELLAIIESFKHWRHYLEGAQHEVLVFTNHYNLKKFIETTRLSPCQIR